MRIDIVGHLMQLNEGKVVAVGPGRLLQSGEVVAPGVKEGDRVLLPEFGGMAVKLQVRCHFIPSPRGRPDLSFGPRSFISPMARLVPLMETLSLRLSLRLASFFMTRPLRWPQDKEYSLFREDELLGILKDS